MSEQRQTSEIRVGKSEISKSMTASEISSNAPSKKSRNIDNIHIQSISEDRFKKNVNCFICQVEFGSFSTRQHHCRYCSESVCDLCSCDKINEQRACDLCFLKVQNIVGEKRKKEFKKTLKAYKQSMNSKLTQGAQELKQMEAKIQEMMQKQIEQTQKITQDKESLQQKLVQSQQEQDKCKDQIRKFEQEYFPKLAKLAEKNNEIEALENQLKMVETDIALKEHNCQGKQSLYEVLRKSKIKIEQSEDFQKLPNYDKAKKYGDEGLSEAIISLDKQIPPESYFENDSKLRSNSSGNIITPHDFKMPQNQNSYAKDTETNVLLKDYKNRNRSESLQNIKMHNVNPRGDKFLCYN